jgi:hypothetical protein
MTKYGTISYIFSRYCSLMRGGVCWKEFMHVMCILKRLLFSTMFYFVLPSLSSGLLWFPCHLVPIFACLFFPLSNFSLLLFKSHGGSMFVFYGSSSDKQHQSCLTKRTDNRNLFGGEVTWKS